MDHVYSISMLQSRQKLIVLGCVSWIDYLLLRLWVPELRGGKAFSGGFSILHVSYERRISQSAPGEA